MNSPWIKARSILLRPYYYFYPSKTRTIAFRDIKVLIFLIQWGSAFRFTPYQWSKEKKCLILAPSLVHTVLWKINAIYFILYTCFCGYRFFWAPDNFDITDPRQTIHFSWFSTYMAVAACHLNSLFKKEEATQMINGMLKFDDEFNGNGGSY